jgi:uncharacterized protein YeaO (DUF488 family)
METEKLNIFEKISLWWKFDGKYMHKEFARGVKNLWRWFPTIWKDRDWDDTFIFEILRVKLENQAKYIGGRGIHVSAKRDAEKMRMVAKLIKLQQDDFYHMEYMDYQKSEFEFVPTDETKKWFTMENTLISENYDDYFKKYPRIFKEVLSEEDFSDEELVDVETKSKIAMKMSYRNQDRCRKLIFKIMESEISRWWD